MEQIIYQQIYDLNKTGISIHYDTKRGEYSPPHRHDALELHYNLNGTGDITFDNKTHTLVEGEFLLIDSNKIHYTRCANISMEMKIYISRDFIKRYVPDLDAYQFLCNRDALRKDQLEVYLKICHLLKKIPETYIKQEKGYGMRCEAIAMDIMYLLVNFFIEPIGNDDMPQSIQTMTRLKEIIEYMNEHYTEPVSLDKIAKHMGLNKEYFCRFFKQHMGMTYTKNMNLIRLVHIYEDILNTQDNINDIAERHGFTNIKLFRKMFWEVHGCTPKELRK